jgi:predicted HTH transcriptional regulator
MAQTTGISAAEYELAKARVLSYLAANPKVTNRILRTLAPIKYDQAIVALGRMCDEQILERYGKTGGTHYVLAARGKKGGK